jgi:hypothetical protein
MQTDNEPVANYLCPQAANYAPDAILCVSCIAYPDARMSPIPLEVDAECALELQMLIQDDPYVNTKVIK